MNPGSTHLARWIRIWIEKYTTGSELKSSCERGYSVLAQSGSKDSALHGRMYAVHFTARPTCKFCMPSFRGGGGGFLRVLGTY